MRLGAWFDKSVSEAEETCATEAEAAIVAPDHLNPYEPSAMWY